MAQASVFKTSDNTRQVYYDKIAGQSLSPLWEILKSLLPEEPITTTKAHAWRWEDVRPFLLESGDLVTAEEAERRVLVLQNPAYPGQPRVTPTIYAGIQLVLPGEVAPAHRHTPSAFRLILEGDGGYTMIGGERARMHVGDFIITPVWAYHDHGNDGADPVMWLDGLDLPMARTFEIIRGEEHEVDRQASARPEGDSLSRFGSGLLPLEGENPHGLTSPVIRYPFERTREALLGSAAGRAPDAHTAISMRFSNPLTGDWAMPTIGTWMMYLPAGFETAPMRSTDAIVASVIEGEVQIMSGEETFDAGPRDVTVMKNGSWRRIKAIKDTFLFCFSDRSAQQKLGFFLEERG
ncbi:cupin domain-containing protein [Nitratireductor kimnyeongensis]|uniref:Cupin domain-containing protein n=1 Tax=Nitratireductor kimnyeongensis TaxID=430679 RepID=A0ABW0T7L6_9HYPH|nr:cupin domain-containing protein [Nitratireductor kimnyeongensis]QZZ36161.1 cupin domain-containing protein [Nitratireductor kimnyeongensis]